MKNVQCRFLRLCDGDNLWNALRSTPTGVCAYVRVQVHLMIMRTYNFHFKIAACAVKISLQELNIVVLCFSECFVILCRYV